MGQVQDDFSGFNTKPTVERQIHLDIRWMNRQNGLIPGTVGTLSWSSNGNNRGVVNFQVNENWLTLEYRCKGKKMVPGKKWNRSFFLTIPLATMAAIENGSDVQNVNGGLKFCIVWVVQISFFFVETVTA